MKTKGYTKWIITGCMIAVLCVIAVSLFLTYVRIDLSDLADNSSVLNLSALFELLEKLGLMKNSQFTFTTDRLFRSFLDLGSSVDPDTQAGSLVSQLMRFLVAVIIVPYVLIIPELVFSLIRRWWSYLVNLVLSVGAAVFTVVSVIWFLPDRVWNGMNEITLMAEEAVDSITDGIVEQIGDVLPGVIGDIVSSVTGGTTGKTSLGELIPASSIRGVVRDGLGPAFWMVVIGYGLLTVLALAGMIIALRERKAVKALTAASAAGTDPTGVRQDPAKAEAAGPEAVTGPAENSRRAASERSYFNAADIRQGQSGLLIRNGELAGAEIPLVNEWISVGSNPSSNNVVISQPGISEQHCVICFVEATNQYNLVDKSGGATFLGDKPLRQGEIYSLRKGTTICVGRPGLGILITLT